MKLFLGEERINIPDSEFYSSYIGEGAEGIIYQYGKEAIKIYEEEYYGKRLNEEEASKLSKIETKRILLPRRLVYDEKRRFIGYTSSFKMEYYKEIIGRQTMKKFIEDVNALRYDIKTLSENGIIINDLNQNNLLMSDNLYLCDPGMYKFDDKNKYEDIYKRNIIELNYLFTIILLETYLGLTKKQIEILEKYFEPTTRLFTDKLEEEQNVEYEQKVTPYLKKLAKNLM